MQARRAQAPRVRGALPVRLGAGGGAVRPGPGAHGAVAPGNWQVGQAGEPGGRGRQAVLRGHLGLRHSPQVRSEVNMSQYIDGRGSER